MSDKRSILDNNFLILPPLNQRGEDKENDLYEVANGAVLGPVEYNFSEYDMAWKPIVPDEKKQEVVVIGGITILVNEDNKIIEEIKSPDNEPKKIAKQTRETECNHVWGVGQAKIERKSGENEAEAFYGASFACKGNLGQSQRLAKGEFLPHELEGKAGVYSDNDYVGGELSAKAEISAARISTLAKNEGDSTFYFEILNAEAEAKLAIDVKLPEHTLTGGTAETPVVEVPLKIQPSMSANAGASIAKVGAEGEMNVTTVTLLRWVYLLSSGMAAADGGYLPEPEIDGIPITQLPDDYKKTEDSWSKVVKYNAYMSFGSVHAKGKYSKEQKYIKNSWENKDITTVGGALGLLVGFGFELEYYDE